MCEFCSFNGKNNEGNDSFDLLRDPSFAGFFSPDAIEAVMRQAKEGDDGDDSDGT